MASIDLKIPTVGESITEVEIGDWLKHEGDQVKKDDPVVTLESEKATVELPAPEAGTLAKVLKKKGETAKVGEVIGYLETDGKREEPGARSQKPEVEGQKAEAPAAAKSPEKPGPKAPEPKPEPRPEAKPAEPRVMPAAQRVLAEHGLKAEAVEATGPGGRLLKEDVLRHLEKVQPPAEPPYAPAPAAAGEEQIVPMTRLRRTVAERLVAAQQNAALLTTFNEVDMAGVLALRKQYGEAFQQKYQVKLGFMSFFVKATVEALKQFPVLNAEVRDTNIVYHNFYDLGIAIGSGKGLVVPVLRRAERMSFAEIEIAIADFARRAQENKLKVDELQGGTFTISNGGVYGSLLSTPIVNPPQSGVLGMHAIQERPVARDGNVVIRPMMYLALTYDHRIVDGREAVTFLKRIKDLIENPARMLMEV